MKQYFGTDGIRGVVGEKINADLCKKLAYGFAKYLTANHLPGVLFLGTDTRQSKDFVATTIVSGLLDSGIDVIFLGIIPTGMMSYLIQNHQVGGGLMITASHNPANMNGIKVFGPNAHKLSVEQEDELENYMNQNFSMSHDRKGKIINGKPYQREYLQANLQLGVRYDGYRILLDCANGSAALYAKKIFNALGAEVKSLHTHTHGVDINENCGAVYPEHLYEQMKKGHYDIAFAYDGDADRLVVVLKNGRILDGDDLVYAFAQKDGVRGVVGTIMTNQGLADSLDRCDSQLYRTQVGDRYVLDAMEKLGYTLGAESSGHICNLQYNTTCDGIMNSVYIGRYLLENTIDWPEKYPMCTKNIDLSMNQMKQLQNYSFQDILDDFAKKYHARVILRLSGTEPKLRVMIEEKGKDIKEHLAELIEKVESILQA